MKNKLFLFISCFFIVSANAQSKPGITNYYLFPQAGLLNGDNYVSGQVQLSGGIQNKCWMFGLGAAIDYYKVRTVPVFADMRYAFGKNKHYFSYANLGVNMAWALESQYTDHFMMGFTSRNTFSNGWYSDLGIGYAFRGEKKGGCLISLGYSAKTITSFYEEALYTQFPPYTVEYHERKMNYTFNRLVLRLGVRL